MVINSTFRINDEIEYDSSEGRACLAKIERIRDTHAEPLKTGVPLSRFLFTVYNQDRGYRTVYDCQCRHTPSRNVMA